MALAKMPSTGDSNVVIGAHLNGRMKPYNIATLLTHLMHEVKRNSNAQGGKLKVGKFGAAI